MQLIELHILQSFPVTCLNRDDVGSPKTAVFGGAPRARISSQCLKRAIRLNFNEAHFHDPFHTERTKLAHEKLEKSLVDRGLPNEAAKKLALDVLARLVDKSGAAKAKEDKSGRVNMPALIWLAPGQISAAADAIAANKDAILSAQAALDAGDATAKKEAQKTLKAALDPVTKKISAAGIADAPDIALFGRMVANEPTLNVEGAALFSHALSTHASVNEVDFYSAVDDVKYQKGEDQGDDADDAGAAMIGTLEFNSATYYRYAAVNLDLLADGRHLGSLGEEERCKILRAFVKACLLAVPGARKTSMNGATLPGEVLGIRKTTGQPFQLINAFEDPVPAKGKGFAKPSAERLQSHLDEVERIWGKQGDAFWLREHGLDTFIEKLVA